MPAPLPAVAVTATVPLRLAPPLGAVNETVTPWLFTVTLTSEVAVAPFESRATTCSL
jgi:hypothetical protein